MTEVQAGPILQRLQEIIEGQYALNAGTTLREIKEGDGSSYAIHPQVLAFCWSQREGVLRILRGEIGAEGPSQPRPRQLAGPHTSSAGWDARARRCAGVQQNSCGGPLVPLFVSSTEEHLYRNNQFISLSAGDEAALEALYLEYLADLAAILSEVASLEETGRGLWAAQEKHLGALQAFVTGLERRHSRQGESLLEQRVACAEYSAGLQLSVLGIEPVALQEPILDIGCGRGGALVAHLRGLGLAAYGIDRLPPRAGYCVQVDWLQVHLQGGYWGTIVSHMAFSNHFVFHHLYRRGVPEAYARKYMEILAALRVGGDLYYAPGLPFIEPLLPAARFRVATRRVPVATPAVVGVPGRQGGEAAYATRISRIA